MKKQTEWPKVGTGMICIHPDTGKILLGKRLSPYGYGTWNNPGGKLEFGEDAKNCASRETFEETNLTFQGHILDCGYMNDEEVYDGVTKRHWVTLLFAGFVKDPTKLLNKEPDKHSDWQWFSPWSLPEDTWEPMQKWWSYSPYADKIKYNIEFLVGKPC